MGFYFCRWCWCADQAYANAFAADDDEDDKAVEQHPSWCWRSFPIQKLNPMLIFKLILNLVLIQDPPPGAWHDRGRDCVDTEAHALTAFYPSVTQVFCMNQTKPKVFCISVNQTKHEPHSRRYNPQSFVPAHWWFFGPTKRKNWLFTLDWVKHWSFGPTKSSIFPHSDSPSLLCEQWVQILNCGLLGCRVFCTTSINGRSQYVALIILYPCCLLMFCSHFDTWSKWLKCSCAPLENCGKNLQCAIYDVYPQYAMHIMQNASCKGSILTLCQHMNIYEIFSDEFPILQKIISTSKIIQLNTIYPANISAGPH